MYEKLKLVFALCKTIDNHTLGVDVYTQTRVILKSGTSPSGIDFSNKDFFLFADVFDYFYLLV